MTPSVGPEADWELTEGAVFYAREANAEVGLAFILEYDGIRKSTGASMRPPTSWRTLEKWSTPLPGAKIPLQYRLLHPWRRAQGDRACPPPTQAQLLERSGVKTGCTWPNGPKQ